MYNKDFVRYSNKVVRNIGAIKKISNKIKEGILITLENKAEELGINEPYDCK